MKLDQYHDLEMIRKEQGRPGIGQKLICLFPMAAWTLGSSEHWSLALVPGPSIPGYQWTCFIQPFLTVLLSENGSQWYSKVTNICALWPCWASGFISVNGYNYSYPEVLLLRGKIIWVVKKYLDIINVQYNIDNINHHHASSSEGRDILKA